MKTEGVIPSSVADNKDDWICPPCTNQISEQVKMAAIDVCLNILLGFDIGEF